MDVREKTAELNYEAEYNRLKEEMARQKEENTYLREELKNKEKELRYYFGFGDACKLIFGRRYEMDVREKLVELLQDENNPVWRWFPNNMAMMQLVDYLIANNVTVQEWIPVTEMLPKPFENVLVFRDGKISIDYNEGNGWFAYDFNGKRVTHWMPLPQPAK